MNGTEIRPGEIYRHFKGNRYEIVTLARDCEDGSIQVVYKALYPPYDVFVRPYAQFVEELNPAVYPNASQKYRFEKETDGEVTVGTRRFVGNLPEMTRDGEPSREPVKGPGNEPVKETEYEESRQPEGRIEPGLMRFLNCDTHEDRIAVLQDLEGKISDRMFAIMFASLDFPMPDGGAEEKYQTLMKRLRIMSEFDGKSTRP